METIWRKFEGFANDIWTHFYTSMPLELRYFKTLKVTWKSSAKKPFNEILGKGLLKLRIAKFGYASSNYKLLQSWQFVITNFRDASSNYRLLQSWQFRQGDLQPWIITANCLCFMH